MTTKSVTGKKSENPVRSSGKKLGESLGFGKLNYTLMAVGLGLIVLGYIFLASGSITMAPILLVLGYCVVLPVALLITSKERKGST